MSNGNVKNKNKILNFNCRFLEDPNRKKNELSAERNRLIMLF